MASTQATPDTHAASRHPTGTDPANTLMCVLRQFRVVANVLRAPIQRRVKGREISDRKLVALNAVCRSPGQGVNDVARALGVRQPTASQLVKALAAQRLIEVRRDGRDRRAVNIHPSAEGRALLRGLPSGFVFGDRLPLAIRRLDADSISSLERGLTELLESLQTTDPTADGDTHGGRA